MAVRVRSRRAMGLLLGAGTVVALWLGGFVWFATQLPTAVDDPEARTDAIVVLTGGSERLAEGLDLLARRRARMLFVSGVDRDVEVAELMRVSRGSPADFECCVVLGYAADDTRGNADETAAWVQKQGIHSLRLVTSAYHMPRSLLEFRRALPDSEVVPHPVFTRNVRHRDWWRWPGTTALYLDEYLKYLGALVRLGVDRLLDGDGQ